MTDAEKINKKINITELKRAFKEGAIPNERDYGDLIDLAAVGGRVLGATEEDATTPHLGDGLKYADGKLSILPVPSGGVSVSGDGVSIRVDGNALAVTEKGVALRLHQDGGLAIDDNGLHIKTGVGLKADKDGVTVALGPRSGLSVEGNKLAVSLSQASGLVFDDKGALKVNVNAEVKNNFITLTDKGLAITGEGIAKIKEALKEVSLTALKSAVNGTDSGAKDDYKPKGETEAQISQALISAYQKRRSEERTTLPAINVFPQLAEKINLKEKLQEELRKHPKSISEGTEFYVFIQGSNDKKLWDNIVAALTPEGMLQFTYKAGGDILILGVGLSHDKKGQFPIMVELPIKVAAPALSDKSTITLDKKSYLTDTDITVNVVLKDKDNNPVTGLAEIMQTCVKVPNNKKEGPWKESEPGHYSCVYVAGVHGSKENADHYKASLQLPGWADKKESAEYYFFGTPAVTDDKVTIKGEARPGQRLQAEYGFVSNGTGVDDSTVKWLWRNSSGEWAGFATASKLDGNVYIPGKDDVECVVCVHVTPKGKEQSKEGRVAESVPVTISLPKPVPVKEVSVNGHVFARDAGFPTTGFKGAQFTLVVDGGNASDYTWSSTASWVTVADGVVTFTNKGDGNEVTITGQLKADGGKVIEYKFKLKKWFTNLGEKTMTWSEAKSACEKS
ncbi:TPA: hypothetical protein ACKQJM_003188 [Serratia marcescens]